MFKAQHRRRHHDNRRHSRHHTSSSSGISNGFTLRLSMASIDHVDRVCRVDGGTDDASMQQVMGQLMNRRLAHAPDVASGVQDDGTGQGAWRNGLLFKPADIYGGASYYGEESCGPALREHPHVCCQWRGCPVWQSESQR